MRSQPRCSYSIMLTYEKRFGHDGGVWYSPITPRTKPRGCEYRRVRCAGAGSSTRGCEYRRVPCEYPASTPVSTVRRCWIIDSGPADPYRIGFYCLCVLRYLSHTGVLHRLGCNRDWTAFVSER